MVSEKKICFYVLPMTPPSGARIDPMGTLGRIYIKEDHYTLLHTKYECSGPCGFREEDFFYVFPIASLWELITPGAGSFFTPGPWLAGFTKRTTIHCYTQNMKVLGLVVSEKKIFLYIYITLDAPGAGPVWTPGAQLAGFMKRTTRHCNTQNMKALGLVVSEEKIVICFSHCKSMGAICCHGNQSSDPTWIKT